MLKATGKRDAALKYSLSLIISLCGILMIIPFVWMISSSLKRPIDVFSIPIQWIPEYWYPQNFISVWTGRYYFLSSYFNSIKVSSINVIGAIFTSACAGYAFARIRFKGRDTIFLLYLATMMIPPQVTIIPRFILFNWLGILNSHYSLILPGIFTVFGTFLMRQAYLQVPNELSESAYMDGAGEIRIWWQIITPLIKPTITALALLVFIGNWNNYEEPLIFLTGRKLFTIPVALSAFTDENISDYNLIMAASVSALLPVIIVFIIGQKYFIKGLIAGAVKG